MADKLSMSLDDIISMKVKREKADKQNQNKGVAGRKNQAANNRRSTFGRQVVNKKRPVGGVRGVKPVVGRGAKVVGAGARGGKPFVPRSGQSAVMNQATKKLVQSLVKKALKKRTLTGTPRVGANRRGGVAAVTPVRRAGIARILPQSRAIVRRGRQQVVPARTNIIQRLQAARPAPQPIQIVRQVRAPIQYVEEVEAPAPRIIRQQAVRPRVIRQQIVAAPRQQRQRQQVIVQRVVPQQQQVVRRRVNVPVQQRVQQFQRVQRVPQRQQNFPVVQRVQRVQRVVQDFQPQGGRRNQQVVTRKNDRFRDALGMGGRRPTQVIREVRRFEPVEYVTEQVVRRGRGFTY